MSAPTDSGEPTGLEVAVIGMAGRFPGAESLDRLWQNLRQGRETISTFSREELEAAGATAAELDDPNYVPARAMVEGAECFDAAFFDINPREAEILDPQHRLFLETAWHALEDAACDPSIYRDRIGLFGGVSMSTYLLQNLLPHRALLARVGSFQAMLANDKDYLTTRVSYKLGLRGPSVLVQTACSTSLVAVHLACQSLISGECETALAGGVSVTFPQHRGYTYQDGAIFSPDGHCRPFDHRAQGTVNGDGVGVVVLKRLEDALEDGDRIRAVVRGSAINNDGSDKVGFTAPSVAGQVAVISAAQVMAEVDADSIGYVEGHGTATPIGDPIELEALDEAFRVTSDRKGFCALGSIKGNFGHLDAAAGIAGFIKTVLVLENGEIPPTVHFERPQPESVLADSAFVVSSELRPWPAGDTPRRAAVSSFGLGGTNAHAVLEEAPAPGATEVTGRENRGESHLLVLSARSETALATARTRLAEHLEAHPEIELADVAYTTQVGRRAFEHRHALVCQGRGEAVAILRGERPKALLGGFHDGAERPVVFLFPGQGSQYPGMARGLYERHDTFRRELDRCAEILRPLLEIDPLALLLGSWSTTEEAESAAALRHTAHAQPLLFAVEWALSRQLAELGITPTAMIGHSLGEYVAACLAGVWSLEDALYLVAVRGRLMAEAEPGAMLTVPLSAEAARSAIEESGDPLELAAINASELVVVTGPEEPVLALGRRLGERGIECRRLHTSHAFHSALMETVLEPFRAELALRPPKTPEGRFVSNTSGDWIRPDEAADPEYWLRHLRRPVRFADGLARLLAEPGALFLEVGPGRSLASLARRQPGWSPGRTVVDTLAGARRAEAALEAGEDTLLVALGRLWLAGARPEWAALHRGAGRLKVALPGYSFDRHVYWIAPPATAGEETGAGEAVASASPPVADATGGTDPTATGGGALRHRPGLATAFEAPANELEERLATLWSELLGVEGVGRHDDFFELGGHSLLGTQLLSRVRESVGAEVPLRRLLEGPTVAELAQVITELEDGGDADTTRRRTLPALEPIPRDGELPLSFSQERLWIVDQLDPGSPAYNISFALRLRGPLDIGVLEACFAELERRHESLRTLFGQQDDRPVQVIEAPGKLRLRIVDLRAMDPMLRESEAGRLVVQDALRPFELGKGPLFRVALVRRRDDDAALLVSFHHIISDGWSFGIIAGELSALYNARLAGRSAELPELEVQYADFAAWQREWLEGEVLAEQVAYWQQKLALPPEPLQLPTRRSTSVTDFRGAVHTLEFPRRLSRDLVEVGRAHRATLYQVIMAAWKVLLSSFGEQKDIVVGSPIAGRTHRRAEPLVGFFVNTLVLRTDLSGDPTFAEILERVRETTHGAYAHQDLPFERLVSALRLDRDLHRMPLFRVWFVLQNTPAERLALGPVEAEPIRPDALAVRHDLKLDLTEGEDGLHGFFEYKTGLFDAAGIEQIAHLLGQVFEEVTRDPEQRLSALHERLAAATQAQRNTKQRKLKSAALKRLKKGRRSPVASSGKDSKP